MSGTLIGYARCSAERPGPHVPADDVPHSPAKSGLPGTVTLYPLTSRISHIRPIFGEYFGDPLVSCTDGHAHHCRLMLGIEATLLGMSAHTRYAVGESLVLVEDC
jgi:hypothetical protein